ncbi:MAG: Gfo/Idh/MocA family protein [Aridibacter sp.]
MKEKIGIGIIGTGFARKTQIPAFQHLPDAEVVSVASGSLENAESTAKEFEIKHWTDNWKETVEKDDVDLICITTPPDLHKEMTLFALEHEKHILCEKPFAMNVAEAEEMTEKALEKNVLALIDHELRFLKGRQKAFEIIREGKIGKIIHFKQTFRNSSRGTSDVAWNWWSNKDAGGGTLGAIGSHAIDTFGWFLDTEITNIFCLLKTNVKKRTDKNGVEREVTSDDEANMILKFADSELTQNAGGTASLSMVEAGEYDYNLKIFGTEGSLIIGEQGEIRHAKMGDGDWKEIEVDLGDAPPNVQPSGWSRGFMSFSSQIVSAIKTGKSEIPHAATFSDGLKIQKVLDAARKSDEKECFVKP